MYSLSARIEGWQTTILGGLYQLFPIILTVPAVFLPGIPVHDTRFDADIFRVS
jgi:hypothetical protein